MDIKKVLFFLVSGLVFFLVCSILFLLAKDLWIGFPLLKELLTFSFFGFLVFWFLLVLFFMGLHCYMVYLYIMIGKKICDDMDGNEG